MNEITRAAVILGAVAIALGATGLWVAYRARRRRSSIGTESLRPWPAVVLFTSTDCDACDPVRDIVLRNAPGDVVREMVYQGSADMFRSAGVGKVPSLVVIDGQGRAVGVHEGQITSGQMERALRRAGLR